MSNTIKHHEPHYFNIKLYKDHTMTIYDSNSISLMNKKSQVGWNPPVSTTFEPSDAIASWAPGKRSGTSRRDTLHPAFPSECPGHHRHNDLETGFARMSKRNGDVGKFRDVNIQYSIHKIPWYNMIYHCKYGFLLTSNAGLRTLERRPFSLSLRCFVLHVADYTPADSLFYSICPDCSGGVQCISKQFRIWVCLTIR